MYDVIAESTLATFDPEVLLDAVRARLRLKNDAALARMLGIEAPLLSKIRHRRLPVGAALLIRMHEVTGLTISDLRVMMGDRRKKYRVSAQVRV